MRRVCVFYAQKIGPRNFFWLRHNKGLFWSRLIPFTLPVPLSFLQFFITDSFFLPSESSRENEHLFAKRGCRTVKKWTGAHHCLPLCGQKEHTREALRKKCIRNRKNKHSGDQDQTVRLTIVIVEHYYGNYKSETAQEEKWKQTTTKKFLWMTLV